MMVRAALPKRWSIQCAALERGEEIVAFQVGVILQDLIDGHLRGRHRPRGDLQDVAALTISSYSR